MVNNSNQNSILAEDEILIRDENGEFKVLKGDSLYSLESRGENPPAEDLTIESLIAGIIKESGLILENNLKKRLEEIIISRLKGVRDDIETKLVLQSKIQEGGLGLIEKQINSLLKVIKNELVKKEVVKLLGKVATPTVLESQAQPPAIKPVEKSAARKRTMDFYSEDEEEITKIKQQMNTGGKAESKIKINEIVQSLISKLNLSLVSEDIRSRLEKAVDSRLRDIRDELETGEMLTRKISDGGLGLSNEQSDQIIKELRGARGSTDKPTTTKDISQIRGARQPVKLRPIQAVSTDSKITQPPQMIAPPPPAIIKSAPVKEPNILPQMKRPVDDNTAKKQVVDVKFSSKLFGPTEELAALSLIDFRRLSKDPKTAIQKIIDKISLLEEESFRKRIDGIRSWQMSEVYKLYSNIGEISLRQEKPIKQVIEDFEKQGKPVLTEAEFDAIMELNKTLRF